MSVQQEKKSYQRNQPPIADKHNTSSRVGLRSCLRGGIEIEEAESKQLLLNYMGVEIRLHEQTGDGHWKWKFIFYEILEKLKLFSRLLS